MLTGASARYDGDQGEEYFAWQSAAGLQGAEWNSHFFSRWIRPTDDVLDFGCGGGFLLRVLPGARKVGVEINPHARKVAEQLGISVAPDIASVDGNFDVIISSHALEHVENPCEALRDLAARLKGKDSRVILLLRIDDWRAPDNRTYRPDDPHQHLYTWTPQLIGNLMKGGLHGIEWVN